MQTAKESTNRIGLSSPPPSSPTVQAGRQVSRVSADSSSGSIGSRVRVGLLGAWHYLQVTRKPDVNGSSCRMRPGSGTKEEIKICRHKTARFEFWRDFWLRLCINFRLPARGWRSRWGGRWERWLATIYTPPPPHSCPVSQTGAEVHCSPAAWSCIIKICKSRPGYVNSSSTACLSHVSVCGCVSVCVCGSSGGSWVS